MALAAQGLSRPRSSSGQAVGARALQGVIDRLAQFQIDSVNVVQRAHYLPLFSRLGPYDPALLDRASGDPPRRLFEYWGHAASLIDVRLQPALRWRMNAHAQPWPDVAKILADEPALLERIRADLSDGALTARQIEHAEERDRTNWGWNWSQAKHVLEWLLLCGEISVAGRNASFERRYAPTEQVLPATIASSPTPEDSQAHLMLVRRAAAALGVATLPCLADYFRLGKAAVATAVATLEATGELVPVAIEGWAATAWLWAEAAVPRAVGARALVSPFDSAVFERTRLERLFGFDYRIEIYVPPAKRRYGYYVYPFLMDDRFVARVDLKADRSSGRLLVQAAWLEAGCDAPATSAALAAELELLAGWLTLSEVVVAPRGDLAQVLAKKVG